MIFGKNCRWKGAFWILWNLWNSMQFLWHCFWSAVSWELSFELMQGELQWLVPDKEGNRTRCKRPPKDADSIQQFHAKLHPAERLAPEEAERNHPGTWPYVTHPAWPGQRNVFCCMPWCHWITRVKPSLICCPMGAVCQAGYTGTAQYQTSM